MKIAIFGASGRTGILTVYQALDKGHQVTAFARTPSTVTIQHKNLRVVQGDILEYDKVKQAVEGHGCHYQCTWCRNQETQYCFIGRHKEYPAGYGGMQCESFYLHVFRRSFR